MRLPSFLHKFDLNRKTGMDRRTQMEHDVLLQMTDICKEFPGVKALDQSAAYHHVQDHSVGVCHAAVTEFS